MRALKQVSSRLSSFLLIIILLNCFQVEAQFFTKSSKSIPRMGRRSGETARPAEQYRHLLIDALIDEYGPNLVQALEMQARGSSSESLIDNRGPPSGEIAYRNEQPLDWGRTGDDEALAATTRDERSALGKDPSLAMRALNTNRYIQYLTSGQPLMSYGKLFGDQDGSSSGERENAARKRQHKFIMNDR